MKKIWIGLIGLVILVVAGVGLYLLLKPEESSKETEEGWVYPSARKARGAVVSNGGPCANIGMNILKKYGNAVDSLIATMLCDGVTCMQNMGIGGGFIATLYIKSKNTLITVNARETAPAAATQDMFKHNESLAQKGALSVAIPGELKGYWEMHQRYGGETPWAELFTETIQLCEEGVPVNQHLANNIKSKTDMIMMEPTLRKILINEKGELPKFGDKIKLPKLAETFRAIAQNGVDVFYNGNLTKNIVKDIRENGGIITEEDFKNYSVRWEDPVTVELSSGMKFFSVPAPGSGPIIAFILRLLDNILPKDGNEPLTTAMITEAFKFAYARRSEMGDPHFVDISETLNKFTNSSYIEYVRSRLNISQTSSDPFYYGAQYQTEEDHGTANIVVLSPDGDAVAATSTINLIFGSAFVSESTGIILNNEMDDFSSPGLTNYFGVAPSPSNFIAPGKRPMSSMCPSILLDQEGQVRLIVGAAGGTRITTATALVTVWDLFYNQSITDSARKPRFHHQLLPMEWVYDHAIPKNIVEGMKNFGHKTREGNPTDSCTTAISRRGDYVGASSDHRRPGNTSYLL